MIRLCLFFSFFALTASASKDVFAFVDRNCAGCHNAKVKNGDIDLASLRTGKTFDDDREIWEKAVEKLKTGQMPPPGLPKPPAAQSKEFVHYLEAEFARQDKAIRPDAGTISARRLNRAEYNNTIRDLFGVDLKPADAFPADAAAFGFSNISDALTLSPALLENYLDAAEMVIRKTLSDPPKLKPSAVHYSSPVRMNILRGQRNTPKDMVNYDHTGLSTLHSMHVLHRFPVDAEYSFRVVLNGHRPDRSESARPALWLDGRMVKEWEVDATDLEGQVVEVRTRVTAGEHLISASYLKNYHGLPAAYGGPEPSRRPAAPTLSSTRGKLSQEDIETLRKLGTRVKTDGVEERIDNRFESIDVGGPFAQESKPSAEAMRRIYICQEKTAACRQKIVANFATKAFRRPVRAQEIAQYTAVAAKEGIPTALQAILVSPQFLYRIEQDRPAAAGQSFVPVSNYELASRLSYFLWSSMPDDQLFALAANGTLRQPAVLAAQVRRMLKDAKADALVEEFGGQWLQFKNIDIARPDAERFPAFDDGLRQAMRRETSLFLANVMRGDAPVLDILDANYTFLNDRLAWFYGVKGVTGPEFRRVDMTGTNRGGGILAHGSMLTTSSYSTRTSPVLRGAWVLEHLLNSPPPPPPPSVPALDDTKVGQTATLRTQMEQHRKNTACASCHARMDPLGFGLENFNAIGAWRDEDGKLPVDAAGALIDGRTFQTPGELRAILKTERQAFVEGLTEKLMIYALGRGLERYDKPVLKSIAGRAPAQGYRFSELALSVVNSLPFQAKRPKGR
jgi:hypothetical protein